MVSRLTGLSPPPCFPDTLCMPLPLSILLSRTYLEFLGGQACSMSQEQEDAVDVVEGCGHVQRRPTLKKNESGGVDEGRS